MLTELECRLADVSVQLERALSKNATLEGRNQLLETFLGLQSKVSSMSAQFASSSTQRDTLRSVHGHGGQACIESMRQMNTAMAGLAYRSPLHATMLIVRAAVATNASLILAHAC